MVVRDITLVIVVALMMVVVMIIRTATPTAMMIAETTTTIVVTLTIEQIFIKMRKGKRMEKNVSIYGVRASLR